MSFSVFAGSLAGEFFEGAGEMGDVGVAGLFRDILDIHAGSAKEGFCLFDPHTAQKIKETFAGFPVQEL